VRLALLALTLTIATPAAALDAVRNKGIAYLCKTLNEVVTDEYDGCSSFGEELVFIEKRAEVDSVSYLCIRREKDRPKDCLWGMKALIH